MYHFGGRFDFVLILAISARRLYIVSLGLLTQCTEFLLTQYFVLHFTLVCPNFEFRDVGVSSSPTVSEVHGTSFV